MKHVALFLLTLVCFAPLFAQTPDPAPITVPTPYAETNEAWQNFAPEEEQFSLEVPGAITPGFNKNQASSTASNSTLPTAELAANRRYLTLVGGDYYHIFSDPVSSPDFNKAIYSFAESQAPGIDPNQIYAFIDQFGFYHKILIVKSGDRVYTFQTVSAAKDSISAKRFFDSIKIKGMKLQANEVEALQNVRVENSRLAVSCNPAFLSPAPVSKPAENKTGNGISSSSETPVAVPVPTPVQTTPIKILSKPRPGYTDFARFYLATGTVALRVTFLANGKVGSISTARRVPFGLTEQAIGAACQIQFDPASKNGVPYAVTRQVQYNFTLY